MDKYQCKNCQWEGSENELAYDTVDTCFGDDKIEMCPECGSYEMKKVSDNDMKQN